MNTSKKTEQDQSSRVVVLDMSIRDVYEKFIISRAAMRVTPATMKYYTYFLPRYVEYLEQNGITSLEEAADPHTVEAFIQYLAGLRLTRKKAREGEPEKGYSDSTIHIYARTIRTMLIYAYESGWLKHLPRLKMPILHKKKLPVLNEDGIVKVIQACRTNRDKAIIMLFLATGMRRSEMKALNWGSVDFAASSIEVLEGKGQKYRQVKFDKETGKILMRYKIELGERRSQPKDPVFQNRYGERLALDGYRALFTRLIQRSGVHFTPHALRRTFAKLCVKRKMDLIFIQTLMGHASADTTERYIQQLDDEDVREAYDDHTPLGEIARKALRSKSRK